MAATVANLASGLKPGGHLVIIDFYKKDRPDHIRLEHDDVIKEIEANVFKLTSQRDKIWQQSVHAVVR